MYIIKEKFFVFYWDIKKGIIKVRFNLFIILIFLNLKLVRKEW